MKKLSFALRSLSLLALVSAGSALASPPALTKAFIRSTHPYLDDARFEAKWREALANPMMFVRAFPAAYHRWMATVAVPGKEGLCYGDAHPGNFGFVLLSGHPHFAYNDLDDSGFCRVAVDSLRYFTALHLFFGDGELVAKIVERYVDALKDASRAEQPKGGFWPDWEKVGRKGLEKSAPQGRLVGEELMPASAAEVSAVARVLLATPTYARAAVRDVAAVKRDHGGSGGLRRYWALVDRGRARTIVELKEAATPGTDWGAASHRLDLAHRLATLKPAFWGTASKDDYFYVALAGATFLVRDRLAKKSLDVTELAGGDRKDVLQSQASLLATLHRKALASVKKDDLRAWLLTTAKAHAEIWRAAYRAGGGR